LTRAVDTSVLARVILHDDVAQAAAAARALAQPFYISLSVILETVWLLRSRYKLDASVIADSLADILDLETAQCEQEAGVRWALSRFAAGAAIGDMIHLVSARHQASFVTFDMAMARDAGPDTPVPIEILR